LKHPEPESFPFVIRIIANKFKDFRYVDLFLAVNEALDGSHGLTFKHYGKPIAYELLQTTFKAYRSNHPDFFKKAKEYYHNWNQSKKR